MMRLLVTGAAGQLAREVIRAAVEKGFDVKALERADLDIADPSAVHRTAMDIKPDVIINCAAYNDVDAAEGDWEGAFAVNGLGPKHLALAANKAGATLVHFSTDYVFDGKSGGKPYTIMDMADPIQNYGSSKLLGEENVRQYARKYYLVRTSWVFGGPGPIESAPGHFGNSATGPIESAPGHSGNSATGHSGNSATGPGRGEGGKHSFPLKVLSWAEKNETLRVVDDQISSPSYAVDLAAATLELIASKKYGIYHMTNSGGGCSRFEWAKFVLELSGWDGTIEPAKSEDFPAPAKRPAYSVLDNFPLKETIGRLLPSWQDGTERFLRSQKQYEGTDVSDKAAG